MKWMLLFLLLMTLIPSANAQSNEIIECLPDRQEVKYLYWYPYNRDYLASSISISPDDFYQLEGEYIEWLGYAPRNLRNYWKLEREGKEYGYKGVNLNFVQYRGVFYLINANREKIARFDLSYSTHDEKYILQRTTLDRFAATDGTAYDFHGYAVNGVSCHWWIDKLDFIDIKESNK